MRSRGICVRFLMCVVSAAACADGIGSLRTGAIRVVTTTSGQDVDSDGYAVLLGPGRKLMGSIQPNGSILIEGLTPADRSVILSGIAENCAGPSGTTQRFRSVTVRAADTVDATFIVACAANVGRILVERSVSGDDPDPDGYFVSLDGGAARTVSQAGVIFDSVTVGDHSLTVSGLATNCTTPVSTITTTVRFNVWAVVRPQVSCRERVGYLRVRTATTGIDPDADGYTLEIDGSGGTTVPPNATVIVNIREGNRELRLAGISGNCAVAGLNPRSVAMEFDVTTEIAFDVSCTAAPRLRVSTVTTGVDADPEYRLRVEAPNVDRRALAPGNGSITLSGFATGSHQVTLEDVGVNCAVVPATENPRTVTLSTGDTTDLTFSVTCSTAPTIAFVRPGSSSLEVFIAKANGSNLTQLTSNVVEEHDPVYSPDGARIAMRANYDIYAMNADGSAQTRLTNNLILDANPEWSPNGSRIAFRTGRDGNDEIYVMNADGTNVTRLTNHPAADQKPTWSPDGSKIAFMSDRTGRNQIWVMNADGSNLTQLTKTSESAELPAWSPDGSKIAFVRYVECDDYYYWCHNIFVMNADGSGEVRFATRSHDTEPAWSPDGQWIAFETRYCTYYDCREQGISAVRADGRGRTVMVPGELYNPTWKP